MSKKSEAKKDVKVETSSHAEQLADYKKALVKEGQRIVTDEFPRQVMQFNALLLDPRFSYDRMPELLPSEEALPRPGEGDKKEKEEKRKANGDSAPPPNKKRRHSAEQKKKEEKGGEKEEEGEKLSGTAAGEPAQPVVINGLPVYGFSSGSVPCNAQLAELMDEVRPMLRDAVEMVNKVKMWIVLLIPKIEDGNNFGVGIQEETLNEVRTVEGEAASFLDQMSRYFVSRAKLITKVAKYPHVDDYRRAILDMDEKQFINIRLVIQEMRNHFCTLHDVITKNMEKILRPRSSNHEHMY